MLWIAKDFKDLLVDSVPALGREVGIRKSNSLLSTVHRYRKSRTLCSDLQ